MELVIHGDAATAPAAWNTRGDRAMWSNEKAVEKVRQGLAAIPLQGTVNMMFDERADSCIVGSVANGPEAMKPLMGAGVNLFIRNNSGSPSRHNMLTPWILIHRLHHSYELCGKMLITKGGGKVAMSASDLILKAEAELRDVINQSLRYVDGYKSIMFSRACTMKSARINQLFHFNLDVAAELFAQKLITGKITFAPANEWKFDRAGHNPRGNVISSRDEMIGKYKHFYTTMSSEFDFNKSLQAKCDAIIAKYEPLINQALDYELEMMKTIPNVI